MEFPSLSWKKNNYKLDLNKESCLEENSEYITKNSDCFISGESRNNFLNNEIGYKNYFTELHIKNKNYNLVYSKYCYRKFILAKLIKFINKYDNIKPIYKTLICKEEIHIPVFNIFIQSTIIEEKILSCRILANLSFISNEVIEFLTDTENINTFIDISDIFYPNEELEKFLFNLLGNMITINYSFIFSKTNFLNFYIRYINKNFHKIDSDKIWLNGLIIDLFDIYSLQEKHIVIILDDINFFIFLKKILLIR